MKKIIKTLEYRWVLAAMLCFLSLGAVSVTGCAGRTTSSTVTTQTTDSGMGTTSSVTTQKQVETDAHPRGVIGGVFYTIGQVLLFPFRVIGNLFS